MESRKDIHERYLDKLEKHVLSAKESSKYSTDRFDILLISLSTSALILSIGFVEKVLPNIDKIDTSLLKLSWLLLVIVLVSNLTSQVTGYYGNQYDIKVTNNLIREERDRPLKGNSKRLESLCKNLNRLTIFFNGVSLFSLIFGIIILVHFFSNNI